MSTALLLGGKLPLLEGKATGLELVTLGEGLKGCLLVKGRLGIDNEGEQLLGEGVHSRIVKTVRKVYEGLPFANGH